MLHSLLDKRTLDSGEKDYLDVLGRLIEDYEKEEHPIAPVSDVDMLKHLIEAKRVTQTEVAKATGIKDSTISEILKGKRKLTRGHIDRLVEFFHVSTEVFHRSTVK